MVLKQKNQVLVGLSKLYISLFSSRYKTTTYNEKAGSPPSVAHYSAELNQITLQIYLFIGLNCFKYYRIPWKNICKKKLKLRITWNRFYNC